MHHRHMLIIASVLSMAAGSASAQSDPSRHSAQSQPDPSRHSAQSQPDPSRHSAQIADRLTRMRGTLPDAIAAAEKHSSGTAVGVRVSMSRDLFHSQADGDRSIDRPHTAPPVVRPRDAAERPRENAPAHSTETLYAIVLCVVERTKVREVVIDMRDNSVVGMQSATMFPGSVDGDDRNREFSGDQRRSTLVRASDLMNASVRNANGDKVGDIDELVIDPDSNRVVYGVLRRGGFLGIGESRYAVASSELSAPQNGRILLNLNNSDFKDHSGFDNKNWPLRSDPKWSTATASETTDAPTTRRVVKASSIIGSDVQCRDGDKVGTVQDLIVEPRSGRVVYVIVESPRGQMPVPMAAMQMKDEMFTMAKSKEEVRAVPVIDSDRDPNWDDAAWNRRLHDSYGTRMETPTVSRGRDGG